MTFRSCHDHVTPPLLAITTISSHENGIQIRVNHITVTPTNKVQQLLTQAKKQLAIFCGSLPDDFSESNKDLQK